MSSGWNKALMVSLRRPGFLLVVLVLLGGTIGISAATSALKLYFRKEALPLRAKEGLTALPMQIGNWVCASEPQSVNADLEHDLGTKQYVFRDYVDTSATVAGAPVATKAEVLALESLPPLERLNRLNDIRNKKNTAVLSVAVTYYTGKVDTVPHVPDRCYVADGFQPTAYDVKTWNMGEYAKGVPREAQVRFIDFQDQTARGAQNRCVAYFFNANGEYKDSPLVVRQMLQDLRQRYAYFAKIEVMTLLPNRPGAGEQDPQKERDRAAAAASMQRFLAAALPEVEKILPDWNARPR